MKLKIYVIALAIVICSSTLLPAAQFIPLSIEEMTQKAQLVLRGTVLNKSCQRDEAGRIYTKVNLDISEVLKGTMPADEFRIVHSGGQVGENSAIVPGQVNYAIGEEVVAFVVLNQRGEGVTIGLAQGKFQLWDDPDTGEKLAKNIFHGAGQSANPQVKTHGAAVQNRLTFSELKQQVKGATQ